MTVKIVDARVSLRNAIRFEMGPGGMIITLRGFSERILPYDGITVDLPPWSMRLDITPDTDQSA